MSEAGYVRITGRLKDIIIRGGENISAAEVEQLLLTHPNVRECAVVGYPDEKLGQRACAVLVLADPTCPVTVAELKRFFIGKGVAKYKIPERVEIFPDLPRTASGKPAKSELRKLLVH